MKVSPFVPRTRLSGSLEKALRRILRSEKQARHGLDADSVHDLRVALRRCRSLAEGFVEMDPRPVWRDLSKACSKQQSGLSELRDAQVMAGWIGRLPLERVLDAQILIEAFAKGERHGRRKARSSLKSFSRKRWKEWSGALPERAGALAVGQSRLARIAFDRATEVCLLERRWRRSHSAAAWHGLRVGVKRFRYAVESFLPAQHAAWGQQLKRMQDMLGEGHDLDVLRARVLQLARAARLAARYARGVVAEDCDQRGPREQRDTRAQAPLRAARADLKASRRGTAKQSSRTAIYLR